jgi:tetratricopeptide (TPR) repeat protein
MKTILSILGGLLVIIFIASALYVFELPPFNAGGPLNPATTTASTQTQTEQLPDFLSEDKIGRAKTYSEYMKRGALLEQNGYHALAAAEYEEAAKLAPKNTEPLMEIGKIHLREKDYISAKVSFEAILKLAPGNLDASVYLVRSLLADRKITEAQTVINGLTEQNQDSKYYGGIIAAYTGDYEKSKSLLNEAVGIGTSAITTAKAQNFLSAYDEYSFNQGSTPAHLKTLLARSFDQVGEYNMAIPLLFEVVRDKKDYRDAWVILGHSYLNIAKYQDAVEALEEAKKLDPQKPETLFYLGLAYYALNDLPNASANLELAKTNGFQPSVQIDQKLSEIYLQQKDYNKSAKAYENVIALADNDVYYYIKPVWIYIDRLNNPQKAMALAQKAYKNHPRDAMSFNLLGWAAIGSGKYTDAGKYLDNARAINPDLDAIYLNYGLLYEKKGEFGKAFESYKKAFEMGAGNSISAAAADSYNKLLAKNGNADSTSPGSAKSANPAEQNLPLSYLK